MRVWNPDAAGVVAIAAGNLLSFAIESGAHALLINPGSQNSVELSSPEIQTLAEGRIPGGGDTELLHVEARKGTKVSVGRPAHEGLPVDFVPTLRTVCSAVEAIKRAYVYR